MKHPRLGLLVSASFSLLASACFSPVSPGPRLSEAASDMNNATRFGRMDVALERVAAKRREGWAKAHAAWGRSVRIVDLEMTGMNLSKNSEAEVMVSVSWQKPDQSTVQVTSILQKWKDVSGTWFLDSEEEKSGDPGLIVEPKKASDAAVGSVSPALPRYQTRVIYGSDE